MRFLTMTWRLLVGVKDALVLLLLLLFFGLLYAALSAKPYAGTVREGALLVDLAGSISEQPATADPFSVVTGGGAMTREYRLRDVVKSLRAASTDSRIKAVALDLDAFTGGGQVALGDVGDAIDSVRRAGKPVVAYATGYSDDSYQLAAHASEIWLNPLGGVLVAGPGGNNLYYKGLLDKLGVTANVYRVGTYKAAVEPYLRSDMSPAAREDAQALADSLWESWLQDVGKARPKAQVAAYAAQPNASIAASGGDMARAALASGLIDKIGERGDFEARMAALAGEDDANEEGGYRKTSLDAWIDANPAGTSSGQIGVLTVAGTIVDGDAGLGSAGAETIVEALKKGMRSGRLKALVVRIDSPGGSVLASERIRRAILAAKAEGLPVVISMGSVAASGGYWIAAAGDTIVAEPATITGSIGVFGIIPSFEGTIAKLGVGADGVRTTPLSGQPDVLNGISPEAGQLIQTGVESMYRRFLMLVADARKMPVARVNEIAQGRVWAGGPAHQLGLVDRFGSLDDAIAEAARRAKLDPADVKVTYLEREPTFFEEMFASAKTETETESASADMFSVIAARPQALLLQAIADAGQILNGPAIQARCLECGGGAAPVSRAERSSWLGLLSAAIGG